MNDNNEVKFYFSSTVGDFWLILHVKAYFFIFLSFLKRLVKPHPVTMTFSKRLIPHVPASVYIFCTQFCNSVSPRQARKRLREFHHFFLYFRLSVHVFVFLPAMSHKELEVKECRRCGRWLVKPGSVHLPLHEYTTHTAASSPTCLLSSRDSICTLY